MQNHDNTPYRHLSSETDHQTSSGISPQLPFDPRSGSAFTPSPKRREARPSLRPSSASPTLPPPYRRQEPLCPLCKGAGYTRLDVSVGHPQFGKPQPCRCRQTVNPQEVVARSHLPSLYTDFSFERFWQLCAITQEQRQAALKVQTFVTTRLQGYEGHRRGLYLYGLWGRGKTGLAVSALHLVLFSGHTGLYLPAITLFETLYEAIAARNRLMRGAGTDDDREEETEGANVLRQIQTVEWLVLDDLGVECHSRFVLSRLYSLIEGRRTTGRFTIFTSNKDAEALAQHWRPESTSGSLKAAPFDDGIRIIERLGEYCVPIQLVGANLR